MESESFKKLKSVRLSQTNMTVRKDLTPGSLFIPLNRVLSDLATIKFNKSSTVTNASTDETFLNRPRLKPIRASDVHLRHQGPVARSLVSANRWLRGIKMYRFPWYLTLVSTNHASSNPGQVDLMYMGRAVNYEKPMQLPIDNIIMCYGCVQSVFMVESLKGQEW